MKKMKIGLICPAEARDRITAIGEKPKENKILRTNRITLLAVAAATPEEHEITYMDEHVEPVDFDEPFDVVGISFPTGLAPRAYEIGDKFRSHGIPVVFGGYHATFMPDEAIHHCDAVCIGEAELSWPEMLKDLSVGNLKKFYHNKEKFDLVKLKMLRRDILKKGAYFSTNLLLAGRGCPYTCEFCSVTHFFNNTYRHRPVAHVIQEIRTMNGQLILFGDDNIVADRNFAKELFKDLIPENIKWMSQANLSIAEDAELLSLAVKSGCIGLFIGFESLSDKNLTEAGKGFYQVARYEELSSKLNENGIAIAGGFMFGFDQDDKSVFEKTLIFAKRLHLLTAQFTILTPFPGTPLYRRFEDEGRIIDKEWSKYDFRHVVFNPKQMEPEELQEGVDWVISGFYSASSIFNRLMFLLFKWGVKNSLSYGLLLNLAYRKDLIT